MNDPTRTQGMDALDALDRLAAWQHQVGALRLARAVGRHPTAVDDLLDRELAGVVAVLAAARVRVAGWAVVEPARPSRGRVDS